MRATHSFTEEDYMSCIENTIIPGLLRGEMQSVLDIAILRSRGAKFLIGLKSYILGNPGLRVTLGGIKLDMDKTAIIRIIEEMYKNADITREDRLRIEAVKDLGIAYLRDSCALHQAHISNYDAIKLESNRQTNRKELQSIRREESEQTDSTLGKCERHIEVMEGLAKRKRELEDTTYAASEEESKDDKFMIQLEERISKD